MKFKQLRILMAFILSAICTAHGQSPSFRKDADSAYYYIIRKNDYIKGIQFYESSFSKGNTDPNAYYNAGCCAALLNNKPLAFDYLKRSIRSGYLNKNWMQQDSDLASLHTDPQWSSLMKEFDNLIAAIENLFAGVKKVSPANLIPYRSSGWWGYLDKRTHKVIVKPAMRSLGFMGSCARFKYKDENSLLYLSPVGKVTVTVKAKPELIAPGAGDVVRLDDADDAPEDFPKKVSSANGFKGFTVNEKGSITTYADIYTGTSNNISVPFRINHNYYAVVYKSGKYGIIDQQGNPLPGFDFVHVNLVRNYSAKDTLQWFYAEDIPGVKGFINEKRETKLFRELMKYPFPAFNELHYVIQSNPDSSGILDIDKMEWVLKPLPIKIKDIVVYPEDCDAESYIQAKDITDVYFLVEKGNDAYYIGRKGTRYWPE